MAHDVFVSYASGDKTVADSVCATLESHGVRCWMAPRDVLAGIHLWQMTYFFHQSLATQFSPQ